MANYSIEQKKKRARTKLFRNDTGLTFFGALAYKFDWDVHPMNGAEGYITFDMQKLFSGSDGKIHINENLIKEEDYDHNNLVALIMHELLHILERHAVRRGMRDFKLWNMATDHCIDRELKTLQKTGVRFYKDQYNIIPELESANPKCTAEEAYNWIVENQKKYTIKTKKIDGGNGVAINITNNETGQSWTVNSQAGGVDQANPMISDDRIGFTTAIENFLSQARALYQTVKDKGHMSGGFKTYLDNLLKVEIPWETLLEKAIKTNTIMKPDDRSWSRPNKFYINIGITLPGVTWVEDDDGIGELVVIVDTSGSIRDNELKKFSSVIMQSMKFFETIRLITHDVGVHQEHIFRKDDIGSFLSYIKLEGFKGRGGTSHTPVFQRISDIWENDTEFVDNLSMVISMTDGYSDIETIYKNYRWIKNKTPLVFVVGGGSTWNHNFDYDSIQTIHIK